MPVEAWFSHKVQILWLCETVKILFCLYEFDNHAETETISDYLFVQLIADGQCSGNLHEYDHYLLLQIHLVTLEAQKHFRMKRA